MINRNPNGEGVQGQHAKLASGAPTDHKPCFRGRRYLQRLYRGLRHKGTGAPCFLILGRLGGGGEIDRKKRRWRNMAPGPRNKKGSK